MSIRALNWVLNCSRTTSPVAQLVLLVLADRADDSGFAYPSVATIARRSKLSDRGVQRATRALVDAGDLRVEARGGRFANRYWIVMSDSEPVTESHRCQGVTGDDGSSKGCRMVTAGVTAGHRRDDEPSPDPSYIHQLNPHGSVIPPTLVAVRRSSQAELGNLDDRFNQFWAAYPRKTARKAALEVWRRIAPDDETTASIVAAVERESRSAQWGNPQFIPHARTYLNQERWKDEPGPSAFVAGKTAGNLAAARRFVERRMQS